MKFLALVVVLLLGLGACTTSEDVSTTASSTRDQIIAVADEDEDGVVSRAEFEFMRFISDPNVVVGSFGEIQLRVSDVLASLEQNPPTRMDDPANPGSVLFSDRLTNMLKLRLLATSLNEFGFEVDLSGDEQAIGDAIKTVPAVELEEFAQARFVRDDPGIAKFSSPHCVILIATPTQADTEAAVSRVRAGENARAVAVEVNLAGAFAEPDGDFGCRKPTEWLSLLGGAGAEVSRLEQGEISPATRTTSALSPTNELHIAVYVEEVRLDEADLTATGPFASRVLLDQMMTYEVSVAPELGKWVPESLSILLPTS